jgi:hypothetical protein
VLLGYRVGIEFLPVTFLELERARIITQAQIALIAIAALVAHHAGQEFRPEAMLDNSQRTPERSN